MVRSVQWTLSMGVLGMPVDSSIAIAEKSSDPAGQENTSNPLSKSPNTDSG